MSGKLSAAQHDRNDVIDLQQREHIGLGTQTIAAKAWHCRRGDRHGEGNKMKLPGRSYTAYSIGLAVAWIVVLAVVAATGNSEKLHTTLLVSLGYALGWCSGTIARFVYPPPAKWRPVE